MDSLASGTGRQRFDLAASASDLLHKITEAVADNRGFTAGKTGITEPEIGLNDNHDVNVWNSFPETVTSIDLTDWTPTMAQATPELSQEQDPTGLTMCLGPKSWV
jgi:hypothetical protein